MGALNNNVKKELANALDDKNESMFIVDGKLISLEVHDTPICSLLFPSRNYL